jgi:nicotinamide mononucleotide adenylyltransferase
MVKTIVAIYPGRFQPFGKHHAAAFLWLQKQFGTANTYIVTSDKVELHK